MQWAIPEVWKGDIAYIIGGGPSLAETNLSRMKGKRIIGVNDAFKLEHSLGFDIEICWFGDKQWHEWNVRELKRYKGKVATCHQHFAKDADVRYVARGKPKGIDERKEYVSWNLCSGLSAINLAYHLGARTIVLIAFDMKARELKEGNKTVRIGNWHSNHKVDLLKKGYLPYANYLARAEVISQDAKRLGANILNATVDTAIPESVFERVRLGDIV